jgi:hypothetical protein
MHALVDFLLLPFCIWEGEFYFICGIVLWICINFASRFGACLFGVVWTIGGRK